MCPLMRIEGAALRRALDVTKEPRDGHIEHLSDVHQSRNTQAIRTDFIFLDLLRGNSYGSGKLILRDAEHAPALSDLPSNRLVDGRRSPRLHAMGSLDTTLH
jgi:hypothetical protein